MTNSNSNSNSNNNKTQNNDDYFGGLSLNIVATPTKNTTDDDNNNNNYYSTTTTKNRKKRKRLNRFDKRRLNAAAAKKQKSFDQEKEQNKNKKKLDKSKKKQDEADNVALKSKAHSDYDSDYNSDSASDSSGHEEKGKEEIEEEVVEEKEKEKEEVVEIKEVKEQEKEEKEEVAISNEPNEEEPERAAKAKPTTSTNTSTSTSTTTTATTTITASKSKSEQDHAAYMAEFHARPLELDRRSGAKVVKKLPKSNYRTTTTTKDKTKGKDQRNDDNNQGDDADAKSLTPWKALGLHDKITSLAQTLYPYPTNIQKRTIRALLLGNTTDSTDSTDSNTSSTTNTMNSTNNTAKKNAWIQSETGSGKTMAYFLPILQTLYQQVQVQQQQQQQQHKKDRSSLGTRCIIICPTQELVQQTHIACEQLCQKLCAGVLVVGSFKGQTSRSKEKARIRKGISILISTPGRLLDHLQTTAALQTACRRNQFQWLVLDEVDRLFDLGLAPQLKSVIDCLKQYTATTSTTTTATATTNDNDNINNNTSAAVPWRSVLVSATVPTAVQELVQECLSNSEDDDKNNKNSNKNKNNSKETKINLQNKEEWAWIQGDDDSPHDPNATTTTTLSPEEAALTRGGRSLPQQLLQYHILVSAKLRLTTLVAFLAARVAQGERTIVFLSTCASVDYYHQLFTNMECILSSSYSSSSSSSQQNNKLDTSGKGIFGNACSIDKLHGNVPQPQRQSVLQKFQTSLTKNNNNNNNKNNKARVLLATDVAARGLNLQADFTVQYDPPCEVADYIHRAGRVARAGQLGQSVLFVLPSEKGLLSILQQQQRYHSNQHEPVKDMAALSLASTLQQGAKLCPELTHQGMQRNGMRSKSSSSGGEKSSRGGNGHNASRQGEAFCSELQYRMEEFVLEQSKTSKQDKKKRKYNNNKESSDMSGMPPLLDMARAAFLSHTRAYPTKEKLIRHLFSARALHLGHVAKSFALREPPKTLVRNSRGFVDPSANKKNKQKQNAAFDFNKRSKKNNDKGDGGDDNDNDVPKNGNNNKLADKRAMLMANAAKLQAGGFDSF